jgi:TRAP transporter TAXI family solute receptor
MGKAVENHTPIKHWIVQPLGGAKTWAPMLKKNKAHIAIYAAPQSLKVFLGEAEYKDMGPTPIRSITMGHQYMMVFWTTKDRGINSIADLKGKVVYSKRAGAPFIHNMATNQLASAGLSDKDLKAAMTTPSIAQAAKALIEGRIDAIMYPVVPGAVMQINEAKGETVFVNLTKKQADFVAERMPGFFPAVVKANDPRFRNKKEVRWAMYYRTGIYCPANLDPEIVYGVTKAIIEHHDDWKDSHPQAKYWGLKDNPVTASGRPPYHEGAIKYFKEKGIWTEEAQAYDKALLKRVSGK